jgi:RNA 3'-terminal phosphate cyclase
MHVRRDRCGNERVDAVIVDAEVAHKVHRLVAGTRCVDRTLALCVIIALMRVRLSDFANASANNNPG